MEIIISGRHFDLDASLRAYAEAKIQRLVGEYGKLTSARLVLSELRGRVIVEGHVNGKHMSLNARAETSEGHASIDAVFEKLERQLQRHLGRMKEHRGPSLAEAEMLVAQNAEDVDPEDDSASEDEPEV